MDTDALDLLRGQRTEGDEVLAQDRPGDGVSLEQSFTFEGIDAGAGTILRQHLVAFGPLTAEEVEGIRAHGDLAKVEAQLRSYVEA